MLQKLQIRNYAIIDELEVIWDPRLTIITGETGAGKSILMGALGLILGDRADTSVLRDAQQKCVVEGLFRGVSGEAISAFFREQELDESDEIIIRRELGNQGKSRAFVNDTPVSLQALRQLTSMLVDLHQQFDTLELGDDAVQREVVDALAQHESLLKEYGQVYQQYRRREKEWLTLQEQARQAERERDYLEFIYQELAEAQFTENEIENAEAELRVLTHASQIRQVLGRVTYELQEAEPSMVQQLKSLTQQLGQASQWLPDIEELLRRLQSAQLEIQDIADEISAASDRVQMDEERLQELNDRLTLGYKLLKKHGLGNTAELLQLQESLEQKRDGNLQLEQEIQRAEKEVNELRDKTKRLALTVTNNRKKVIAPFESEVETLLKQVGMPNARLRVELTADEPGPSGADRIRFLFDANRSDRFEPIQKVASGGELSRLMLCIKSLVAGSLQMPTLIFDEIDTGISGEAARQVGVILKRLSREHQVIVITHQPQIAARADAHLYVTKVEKQQRITTQVRALPAQERIEAIARMLGGEKPSATALQNAREMVEEI